jgi:hypothetical protein
MQSACQVSDRVGVVFDDDNAIGNGGLILTQTLADRLGVRELVDDHVELGDAPGRANPGIKVPALVAALLAGVDSIDDPVADCGEVLGVRARGATPTPPGALPAS